MPDEGQDAWDAVNRLGGDYGGQDYYDEMSIIGSHAALRRLWIAEGERRGYVLEDCDDA